MYGTAVGSPSDTRYDGGRTARTIPVRGSLPPSVIDKSMVVRTYSRFHFFKPHKRASEREREMLDT